MLIHSLPYLNPFQRAKWFSLILASLILCSKQNTKTWGNCLTKRNLGYLLGAGRLEVGAWLRACCAPKPRRSKSATRASVQMLVDSPVQSQMDDVPGPGGTCAGVKLSVMCARKIFKCLVS